MATSYNLLFWLTLIVFVSVDAWPKYRIHLERFTIVEQNPEYIIAKVWAVKVNRTEFGLNAYFNILKPLPSNTVVTLQCYEFLSNEYRPFAIRISKKLCDFILNEYAYHLYRDMPNMFPPKCPLGPGNYTITNYTATARTVPANLPFKKVMTEYKFVVGKMAIFNLQIYATYDRDVIIREQYS